MGGITDFGSAHDMRMDLFSISTGQKRKRKGKRSEEEPRKRKSTKKKRRK